MPTPALRRTDRLAGNRLGVCVREPVEDANRFQRPQRNIYPLTDELLHELGWPR